MLPGALLWVPGVKLTYKYHNYIGGSLLILTFFFEYDILI